MGPFILPVTIVVIVLIGWLPGVAIIMLDEALIVTDAESPS